MNIKNIPYKTKKLPYHILLMLLTIGASLILGFLSFSGMYALYPILILTFASFALSVAYEGEIYLQNIKNAIRKLFKSDFLENHLAKEYLLTNFPEDTKDNDCPQFFKDYKAQLKLLGAFGHKNLNEESGKRKKQVEQTLTDMEKWFALQLFPGKRGPKNNSAYSVELKNWLEHHQQKEWQHKLNNRRMTFHAVKAFSIVSACFMGLGTTYLIVEAFSVIPFFIAIPFSLWPIFILPMAIVAGAAYGMLTYNAVTDLINNDTIKKWYYKLKNDLSSGLTVRNVVLTISAVLLVALAVALTICTAGTWWTIANQGRPLFEWMRKIPTFLMGIINPIITGISALFFIIENTAESLDMVDQATRIKGNIFTKIYNYFAQGFAHLRQTENWGQILNPFRILAKLIVTPLRILLFFGHLISIAVTADRVPGIPQIVAAIVAIISEGFEDAHYFFPHSHDDKEPECSGHHGHDGHHHHHHNVKELLKERLESAHGHNHNLDIPSLILHYAAHVLYLPATLWDMAFSKLNTPKAAAGSEWDIKAVASHPRVLNFAEAWDKQLGVPKQHDVTLDADAKRPSLNWQKEHTISLIAKHERKHLNNAVFGKEVAGDKIAALDTLETRVDKSQSAEELHDAIGVKEKYKGVYNVNRIFAAKRTSTQQFIEELPSRVSASA